MPIGIALWDQADVTFCVAIALLAACSTTTIVAMTLPWLLHRLGLDPACGSGPLATVIQDLLSLLIYLAVASLMVSRMPRQRARRSVQPEQAMRIHG